MAAPRMAGPSHNIPSVPRIALPNPHHRKPSLSKSLLSARSDADGRGSMDVDANIPVPSIPAEYQQDRPLSPPMDVIGQAVSTSSPIDGHTPIMSATAQRYTPAEHPAKSMSASPDPASNDSGYDSASSQQKSPVVPIRSMFPTYNPNVPLSQQSYHPQRPAQIRSSSLHLITSGPEYRDNSTPIDRSFRYPSAPPSVAGIAETPIPQVSSQRELCQLWEASHGMEPNALTKSFDLELTRPEEATFTFSSDPVHPFYTMTTYDTNELAISKTHPKKQNISVEVSLNTIEPAGRRKPPQDGLVTFIFPKMAAMLAINQSTAVSKEHGLAPTHRDEVQAAAVRRAAEQEACKLRWNAYSQIYELEHPAIGRRQQGPDFAKSPDPCRSPLNTKNVLEIKIHSSNNSLPVITISHPQPSDLASEPSPSIPGIRMSTIPNRDSDNALAVLDLNTRILHIETNRILEQLPSLFAIDSIVSALLTVLVADEHVNPIMAEMELWTPKPKRPQSQWGGSISGVSHAGSGFYATFAEREEAEAEAKELADIHEKDVRQSARKTKTAHKSWFGGKEKAPKQKKKKQIVIADFDLEKLGHYQSGERKGQELPAVTRALLSVLVGTLKAVVWVLTTIVQFVTWLLVNLTRAFTSEKF